MSTQTALPASPSIFTKIIAREIPATIHFENDEFIAFDDIHPKAPVHVLLVPKEPFATLEDIPENHPVHMQLLSTARIVARQLGIEKNYKLFMNVGKDVQEIHHVHLHIMGGWIAGKHTGAPEA